MCWFGYGLGSCAPVTISGEACNQFDVERRSARAVIVEADTTKYKHRARETTRLTRGVIVKEQDQLPKSAELVVDYIQHIIREVPVEAGTIGCRIPAKSTPV